MTPFSFAAPTLLWILGPLIGVLFYVYLRKGLGKEIPVSSVLLLKKLNTPLNSRKKFSVPLRLIFEILLFSLLLLSLAKLSINTEGKHIAIILDNSLSMSANDAFSRAKADAISAISERSTSSTYEIILPTENTISNESFSKEKAINKIQEIEASNFEDLLEGAVKNAVKSSFDEILIFSDKKITTDNSKIRSFIQKEKPLSNVAITNGEVLSESAVRITLHAYTASNGEVLIDIKKALSGENLGSSKARFKGEQTFSSNINLENLIDGPIRIHITPKIEGNISDSIEIDNYFWISSGAKKFRTGVISDLSLEELGLTSISNQTFTKLYSIEEAKDISSLIIHRKAIEKLPKVDTIFILPETSKFFSTQIFNDDGVIASWSEGHPLVSYLNMPTLKLKSFQKLEGPVWLTPVLTSQKGALTLAGELDGKRYSCVGFELFPFEGKRSLFAGVFTLNLLKWTFQRNFSSESLLVGGKPKDEKNISNIRYIIPKKREFWSKSTESLYPPRFDEAGLVESKKSENSNEEIDAVNIISAQESDLFRSGEISVSSDVSSQKGTFQDSSKLDLTKWFIWILLVLLFSDSALLFIRGVGKRV